MYLQTTHATTEFDHSICASSANGVPHGTVFPNDDSSAPGVCTRDPSLTNATLIFGQVLRESGGDGDGGDAPDVYVPALDDTDPHALRALYSCLGEAGLPSGYPGHDAVAHVSVFVP